MDERTERLHELYDQFFAAATAVQAEGARIGIATCRRCGAAILIDPRDEVNYARHHAAWHIDQDMKDIAREGQE